MEKVLEWLGGILNNQKISGVDYSNVQQKDAIRLLRACDIIERMDGDVFTLHPKYKERFSKADKILSIHEKLAIIKADLQATPFAVSPEKSELLKLIAAI